MNPEIKEQWLRALRSGEYRQGHRYLNNGGRFCCLGVLCDLAEKAGVVSSRLRVGGNPDHEDDDTEGLIEYVTNDGNEVSLGVLPEPVQQWAGLDEPNPHVNVETGGLNSLGLVNDCSGLDFAGIADLIERDL